MNLISLDGQTKAVWNLPPDWTEGRPRISPDRRTLAFIGSNFAALVDLESGAIRYLYACNCFGSDSVAWSPDGKYLAASNGDGISLISLADGKVTEMSMDCLDACWNIQWSPDGKWLSYGEGDFMAPARSGVFLISIDCLDQPETCFKQKRGPLAPNNGASMGFPGWSPDGKYLAAPVQGSGDNLALDFISVQTGKVERRMEIPNTHAMHIDAIAWSPDGEWIEYVQQTRGIYLTRTQGGTPIELVQIPDELITILQWISVPHPFAPGSVYTITAAGANLNLRTQPATDGQVLKMLSPGEEITILEGPTLADGYTWWRMRTKDGTEGWAADIPDWYAPQATVTPSPTP